MKTNAYRYFTLMMLTLCFVGCQNTSLNDFDHTDKLTVGVVQKEIQEGMPATDVAIALGSPNIVKKDPDGAEVWVYDKFSSEQIYQTSSGALGYFSGGLNGILTGSQGASRVSSNTLTIIIKFDERNAVDSIAYHRSKF